MLTLRQVFDTCALPSFVRNIKPYFDRNYIIVEDLEHFLSARKAAQAFTLLDVDGDGKVIVLPLNPFTNEPFYGCTAGTAMLLSQVALRRLPCLHPQVAPIEGST